jgi:tetratricopeptide (TPR) repeat protein
MKSTIFLLLASLCSAAFIHLNTSDVFLRFNKVNQGLRATESKPAIGCSPNLANINFKDSANLIPLLKGWGNHRMAVTVQHDSANIYFQQGINMYYGFHIIEALSSFEKALSFDSSFAMGYWGKALAYGPNINDLGYTASPEALIAVQKAKSMCNNCTPVEKALIDAIEVRYTADTSQRREQLNQAYADAMKQVYNTYPDDGDVAALYVDAMMVQHPWDLYDRNYDPKPWTPQIVQVLEAVVKKFPEHPGASHYYIHAVEGSKQPERALQIADRLGGLMPGLAHLVHMPSHIYIRSGYYKKGVEVNEAAVAGYYNYLSHYPATVNNSFLYLMHNRHMQAACANMDGQYTAAMKYANQTKESVDSAFLTAGGFLGMYGQYMYSTPLLTQVRFGKWDDILQTPNVPQAWVYASSMQHFAKGLAYARRQQFEQANREMQRMKDSINSPQLQEHPNAFNPGIEAVQVAEKVLQGVMAEERGMLTQSITLLKEAVHEEDGMLYNEPKDWVLPVRHYLGRVLLKAKQYAEAEKIYKEDLKINPNNAWALTGLQEALQKQNKRKEASTIQQKAQKAKERSDINMTASAF